MVITRNLSARAEAPLTLLPSTQDRKKKAKASTDTAGPAWFNMPHAQMTPELEKDIQLLRMRSALDPKRHYRKNEKILAGKYLQVGTIINNPTGFYNDRLSKRQRAATVIDTLMRDYEHQRYLKNKFDKLQENYQSGSKAAYTKRFARKPWLLSSSVNHKNNNKNTRPTVQK